jgi:hypothetical protein
MRLTSANRFTQKDISSAFEVFTWAASVSLNGKLSEVNLQLLEVEPCTDTISNNSLGRQGYREGQIQSR